MPPAKLGLNIAKNLASVSPLKKQAFTCCGCLLSGSPRLGFSTLLGSKRLPGGPVAIGNKALLSVRPATALKAVCRCRTLQRLNPGMCTKTNCSRALLLTTMRLQQPFERFTAVEAG